MSRKIKLSRESEEISITLEPEAGNTATTKTLRFIGPNGEPLSGKKIIAELSCSKGMILQTPTMETTTGEIEVEAPAGCGAISAKVSAQGFEANSYSIDNGTIRLMASEVENGTAKVSVVDERNGFLDNIEVLVKDSKGVPTGDKKLTSFGAALFSLEPGNYSAFAYDPSLKYSGNEAQFTVEPGKSVQAKVQLSEKPVATVKVKVLDSNGEILEKARVLLELPSGKKLSRDFTGTEMQIGITEAGTSKISAYAEGYGPGQATEINSGHPNSLYELKLSRCGPSTCGALNVIVGDEENMPVANARVGLTDSRTGFFAEEYGIKYTGIDGKALFTGVRTGKYIAVVQKYPGQGSSQEINFKEGTSADAKVQMTIGSGTIEVYAVDETGNEIPFGSAEFISDSNRLGMKPMDAGGFASITTKADKRVFVRVEAEGHIPFTSAAEQVYSGQTIKINAVMRKQSQGNTPSIELTGIFDSKGNAVDRLLATEGEYNAKFRVVVPQPSAGGPFAEIGAFVRAGAAINAESDAIYIDSVNAPGASETSGDAYNEPNGNDEENPSNNEAKWTLIKWGGRDAGTGVLEFSARLKVRASATPGKPMPIYYRAYGVTGTGRFVRDPADSALGDAENSPSKKGLYAESYQKGFFEGSGEECAEGFCFSQRMIDLSQDLIMEQPYTAKIYSEYEYWFSITNNSNALHSNAKMTIRDTADGTTRDSKLKIKSYAVSNADTVEMSSSTQAFEATGIELGEFSRNKTISGKLLLKAEEAGDTGIQLQIVSGQKIVFNRIIKTGIVKEKDINVSVYPQTMPAFTEFDLKVSATALDTESDFVELDNAIVQVERLNPDRTRTVFSATTDIKGNATIRIPASGPGTVIKVRVEKAGYGGSTYKAEVSKDIVSFSPQKLSSNLNLTSKNEEKLKLVATNLVPVNLKVLSMTMKGNFRGLLDEARMNNWLSQYAGNTRLPEGTGAEMAVLTSITQDAKLLMEEKKLDATLEIVVSSQDNSVSWPLTIPVNVAIGLAEPPKENGCLTIGIKEWKDVTLGGKAEAEFSIMNNCRTMDGKPLDLRNLKATLKWKGSNYGNIELHVQNPASKGEASEALQEGLYSTLFDSVPAGVELLGLATFTPKGGTSGKKAEFSIIIDAGQVTNQGEQLVGASNPIESEIDIIDVAECIKYTPDAEAGVVMQEGDDEATLEIDSSACGNVTISFDLCYQNKGCAGGAEGGIMVKPENFTLSAASPKKSVMVSRQEVPGMYGINVAVKTPNSNFREIALVDVLVKPKAEDAFALRKYEFMLKGTGAKDSTELFNRNFVEQVQVDASLCDWGDAEEAGWFNWTWAGGGLIFGALMGVKPAMEASRNAANSVAKNAGSKIKGSQKATQTSKASDEKSKTSIEQVCESIQQAQSSVATAQGSCTTCASAQTALESANTAIGNAISSCNEIKSEQQGLGSTNDSITADIGNAGNSDVTANWGDAGTAITSPPEFYGNGGIALFAYASAAATGAKAIAGTTTKTTKNSANSAKAQAIAKSLQTTAGALDAAQGPAATELTSRCDAMDAEACSALGTCPPQLATAATQTHNAATQAEKYATGDMAAQTADASSSLSSLQGANQATGTAMSSTQAASTAASSTSSFFNPASIMGMFALGGALLGGILGGLMTPDACKEHKTVQLPDYMINILSDAGRIDSGNRGFSAEYDTASARIIGAYKEQRIGVVFTNAGVSDQKPVYSTFTFNATQHLHDSTTRIPGGTTNFGPFSIPDRQRVDLAAKIHLKFKTQEPEETLPALEFDTQECVSGNKIGRTGEKALPKVKLSWSFKDIGEDACLESNPDGVYCDATQFSIMLSKRLKSLKEFFDQNPNLECPGNQFMGTAAGISADLNVQGGLPQAQACFISNWTGYLEGEPAIKILLEENGRAGKVNWTNDIKDLNAFMETVHFNALLMEDAYTDDFLQDFARHYSDNTFFETADWFTRMGNAEGKDYGFPALFSEKRVKFKNRFYDSAKLSSAGTYEVLISMEGDDGSFRFFNPDGTANANITVESYLLHEPNPNSVFYSLPLDGLVGMEGDSFNRQGYGTAFTSSDAEGMVKFNLDPVPMKAYSDSGSNPLSFVETSLEKRLFQLNTSPSGRGSLLIVERQSDESAKVDFRPSRATPVMLRASAKQISNETLSAFYSAASSEVPVDVGGTLTFWDGAGACLNTDGTIVTEAFDTKPDRAANSKDPPMNWETAYGFDFGKAQYTGDVYVRTIFYTNPLEETTLSVEYPLDSMRFITPDASGNKVKLQGVSGMPYNNPNGGTGGSILSVADVFGLVKDNKVCVVDSGRKASFFWNPKAIYEAKGKETSISDVTNSLEAGKSCIGFG
ncbi:Carboxypeptidase regulatory-like domain protein [uncultured archaeon]|nr:Carboxypeptidase regulatory-like domain protein [uncultured archaeon]